VEPEETVMDDYDVGLACLNGHRINGSSNDFPQFNSKFCENCGAEAIDRCPACSRQLRGSYRGALTIGSWEPSAFCYECGASFPWTAKRIEAAKLLACEAYYLTDEQQATLAGTFDDLLRDTPMTPVAVSRFKKLTSKAGSATASALRDVLVDIVAEGAKRSIWGQ
jgi:hypothetical protein